MWSLPCWVKNPWAIVWQMLVYSEIVYDIWLLNLVGFEIRPPKWFQAKRTACSGDSSNDMLKCATIVETWADKLRPSVFDAVLNIENIGTTLGGGNIWETDEMRYCFRRGLFSFIHMEIHWHLVLLNQNWAHCMALSTIRWTDILRYTEQTLFTDWV